MQRIFRGGLSGVTGLALAALVVLGVGVWTTTVSSRMYRRVLPSFARPVPLLAQGGPAGRAALLSAPSTPRALAILELKSALEEAAAHELGHGGTIKAEVLLERVKEGGRLDDPKQRELKRAMLEMANVETAVLARQPTKVKRSDVLRLSRLVFGILATVRGARTDRERAA